MMENRTNNWQVWVDVFSDKEKMVLEGTEEECEKFVTSNNANESDIYSSVFPLAPHTGFTREFKKYNC